MESNKKEGNRETLQHRIVATSHKIHIVHSNNEHLILAWTKVNVFPIKTSIKLNVSCKQVLPCYIFIKTAENKQEKMTK